jgi:hypothetical protein
MNCSRFRSLVSPYLDHELSFNELKEFTIHQEHCKECGELVRHLLRIEKALKEELQVSLSPNFMVNLQNRLQAEGNRSIAWWRRLFEPQVLGLSPVSLSGMAAATIAVVIIAVSLFQPETAPLVDPLPISIPQESSVTAPAVSSGSNGGPSPMMSSTAGDSARFDRMDSSRRDFSRQMRYVSQED